MPYSIRSDVETAFGTTNVELWATLDDGDDAAAITARITEAIVAADASIDDIGRLTAYKVPFEAPNGETPTTIKKLSAKIAGLELYEPRGSEDFNPKTGMPYHRLSFIATRARRLLEAIRTGQVKLDAVLGA